MWADDVRERYWWIKIRDQMEELFCELLKAENEEETDLYLLRLHLDNESELKFFTPNERKKIERLLSILIRDTMKHNDLLAELTERLEEERKHDVCGTT